MNGKPPPLKFHAEVIAENVSDYPDMRLRMIIRQAILDATKDNLKLDEAIQILDDEATYMKNRIKP